MILCEPQGLYSQLPMSVDVVGLPPLILICIIEPDVEQGPEMHVSALRLHAILHAMHNDLPAHYIYQLTVHTELNMAYKDIVCLHPF